MNTIHWYASKTLWMLFAQLLGIWAMYVTGEASFVATVGITMTTASSVIIRFYTNQPITGTENRGQDK